MFINRLIHSLIFGKRKGFILLFTVVVISITVGLTTSLIVSSTRQSQLGTLQADTQSAFYAADMGVDCSLAWLFAETVPDIVPGAIICGNVSRTKSAGDATRGVYYFDMRGITASTTGSGWTGVDWSSVEKGGASNSCGVMVVKSGASFTIGNEAKTGYEIESYGYSTCVLDASAMLPDLNNPNLVERKIIVRIPVDPV